MAALVGKKAGWTAVVVTAAALPQTYAADDLAKATAKVGAGAEQASRWGAEGAAGVGPGCGGAARDGGRDRQQKAVGHTAVPAVGLGLARRQQHSEMQQLAAACGVRAPHHARLDVAQIPRSHLQLPGRATRGQALDVPREAAGGRAGWG